MKHGFGPRAALLLLFALSVGSVQIGGSGFGGIAAAAAPKFVEETESGPLEGSKAPDFSLTTLDGKKVTLSQLKGKVVLLDFWASWCSPCRRSMPHIEETWAKYQKKGLMVIGVNVDKESSSAQKFLNGFKVSYPVGMDPNAKVLGSYQVMSMPTAFLIDKKGIVRHRIVGFSDDIAASTTRQLEALLK